MVLTDDRALQPAENVTPLVRTEVVDQWGDALVDAVDAVSARLTTDGLRASTPRWPWARRRPGGDRWLERGDP